MAEEIWCFAVKANFDSSSMDAMIGSVDSFLTALKRWRDIGLNCIKADDGLAIYTCNPPVADFAAKCEGIQWEDGVILSGAAATEEMKRRGWI
jgi:hypothetical protein